MKIILLDTQNGNKIEVKKVIFPSFAVYYCSIWLKDKNFHNLVHYITKRLWLLKGFENDNTLSESVFQFLFCGVYLICAH